ncbi:hypothetical protein Ahy_A03g016719 isoform B [Arachis hypogaea]|uniref:Major facilitator superfamily (MFS) profile domain-containing protein n=1 Tax=Arachis hypogaea TaxID=3818 RepID=A0A445E457_ARAHY|nr:hypothetical protein Ahy_A03g016719 isoform B [Arachis hypogaea]
MALTTLISFKLSLLNPLHHHHQRIKSSKLQLSNVGISHQHRMVTSMNHHLVPKYPFLLPSCNGHNPKLRFHVGAQKGYASSGEEPQSRVSDTSTYQEEFSWSSVVFPFLFPALGGLLFGYDIGATSGATISLQSPELSGIAWFNLSAIQLGLVVSGSLYGALLGSLLAYAVADFLGRKRQLIVAALLYVLGGSITAYAPELNVLLAGRLLYGLGIGLVGYYDL